jgi:hypothetical protein
MNKINGLWLLAGEFGKLFIRRAQRCVDDKHCMPPMLLQMVRMADVQ